MLTKLTELRRLTRNNNSSDFDKIIEHLNTIKKEKEIEEKELMEKVQIMELARQESVKILIESGMKIPAELSKEITLESYLKKPKRGRKRKVDIKTKTND